MKMNIENYISKFSSRSYKPQWSNDSPDRGVSYDGYILKLISDGCNLANLIKHHNIPFMYREIIERLKMHAENLYILGYNEEQIMKITSLTQHQIDSVISDLESDTKQQEDNKENKENLIDQKESNLTIKDKDIDILIQNISKLLIDYQNNDNYI